MAGSKATKECSVTSGVSSNQIFKVFHRNAQVATNKVDKLSILASEHKPNIFVVTEHGFTESTINFFKIQTYILANYFAH